MTLSPTQPKPGTQHSTSTNDTKRTGRDSFLKKTGRTALEHSTSTADQKSSGTDLLQGVYAQELGLGRAAGADKASVDADRLADGVGAEFPSA